MKVTSPQLFGKNVDCASIISTTALSAIAGVTMTLVAPDPRYVVDEYPVAGIGGMECTWQGPHSATNFGENVTVTALPAAGPVVPTADSQNCSASVHEGKGWSDTNCVASLEINGYWLTWSWDNGPQASLSANTTMSTALSTALRVNMTAAGPAPSWTPPTGSWSTPLDCASIASTSGVLAKIGDPTWQLNTEGPNGFGFVAQGNVNATVYEFKSTCEWYDPASGRVAPFGFEIYPGGAWFASRIESLPGATSITIPGATRAIRVPTTFEEWSGQPGYDIAVFDGVNWLETGATPADYNSFVAAIPSILKALDNQ